MTDPFDATLTRAKARLGTTLRDKWRLQALLGVGGMAAVYSATHTNNGKRVALKVMHSELASNGDVKARFLREGYVANKVEHPGTVQIVDDDTAEDGSPFLVMELLEGVTLEEHRERAPGGMLSAAEVVVIGDKILDVLAAAHDKGVVHRDIKPDNIFLTTNGSVKLLDFGIARLRELSGAKHTMTGTGAIGTPAFMPPEQARGRWNEVGPKTDLWAVGATLFSVVTGHMVHEAETVNELLLAAMTKPAPKVQSVLSTVPDALAEVIDRALAYDANARWPSAKVMQTMLRLVNQAPSLNLAQGKTVPILPGTVSGTVKMQNPAAASLAAMMDAASGRLAGQPISAMPPGTGGQSPPAPPMITGSNLAAPPSGESGAFRLGGPGSSLGAPPSGESGAFRLGAPGANLAAPLSGESASLRTGAPVVALPPAPQPVVAPPPAPSSQGATPPSAARVSVPSTPMMAPVNMVSPPRIHPSSGAFSPMTPPPRSLPAQPFGGQGPMAPITMPSFPMIANPVTEPSPNSLVSSRNRALLMITAGVLLALLLAIVALLFIAGSGGAPGSGEPGPGATAGATARPR